MKIANGKCARPKDMLPGAEKGVAEGALSGRWSEKWSSIAAPDKDAHRLPLSSSNSSLRRNGSVKANKQ